MEASALDKAISALEIALSRLEESSGSLERCLIFWTAVIGIGVSLEILDIIWEYRDDRRAWLRASIRSPERPIISKFIIEIAGAVLVTIGIGGELFTNVKAIGVNTELRNKSRLLVGLVNQKAGEANKATEELRRDNLTLQAKIVDLQSKYAWRTITKEQERKIVDVLGKFK